VSVRESDGAQGLESTSVVELFGRSAGRTSSISRQEPAVARIELAGKARHAAFGVLLSTGASAMVVIALLAEAGTAVAGLTGIIPVRAAALIVAAGLAGVAGLAVLAAVRTVDKG
jgi:hypothetical protein